MSADDHDVLQQLPVAKDEAADFFRIAKLVKKHGRTLLGRQRLYTLWQSLENTSGVDGDVLEVGSYRGGSAYFLAASMQALGLDGFTLHVNDTFEGHPDFVDDELDRPFHPPGHFGDTSFQEVQEYLSVFDHASLHRGAFEEVNGRFEDRRFRLVHCDVDTYVTTKNVLEFMLTRLVPGGIVVLDDFGAGKCPGVKVAATEFMQVHGDNHRLIRLHTQQAVLLKR